MTDLFRLLGQPRQPWLEEAPLQASFDERSRSCHPDRFHQAPEAERTAAHDRYIELNSAFARLREPRSRLLHLIELETGQAPADVQEIPGETTDLFMAVAQACREADRFLKDHADHVSPILKAQRLLKAQPVMNRLAEVLRTLQDWEAGLLRQLQALNAAWQKASSRQPKPIAELERLYRLLSYQQRWTRQIQERQFQLSSPA